MSRATCFICGVRAWYTDPVSGEMFCGNHRMRAPDVCLKEDA